MSEIFLWRTSDKYAGYISMQVILEKPIQMRERLLGT